MRRSVARLKGLGFIIWHTRHHFYHILIGVIWAWFLRELWHEFNPVWVVLAIVFSEFPDIDHFVYFITYGKKDQYSMLVKQLFANREWRLLWTTLENGHKSNTNLATHNYFTVMIMLVLAAISYFFQWQSGVVIFGAMVLHYFFAIMDALFILGTVNPNWKRVGRVKKLTNKQIR